MRTEKNRKRTNGRKNRKVLMIAAAVLAVSGMGAGIFSFMAEIPVQAGMNEVDMVSTSYHVPAATAVPEIPAVNAETEKEGENGTGKEAGSKTDRSGSTANCHVSMSSLNTGEPTSIDLTMEEAAALGVKYLEDIMGFDAEGANVYMMYNNGTITFPRAFWLGDVRFGEEVLTDDDTWGFCIDAVTGELFTVSCGETLDVDVPLGYDVSLETNYGVYAEAAKELTERCNLVGGPVADVKYGNQGYGRNNPDITVEVVGKNGQTASLTFSRYNQRLLGVSTGTCNEISEKAMEDLAADSEGAETQTVYFE